MKCIICNSVMTLYYTQGNDNRYRYFRCTDCGLVSLDPAVKTDQKKYEKPSGAPASVRHKKAEIEKHQTSSFIASNIRERGRLLDIGCGRGRLLAISRDDGWEVTGIDISEVFAAFARNEYGVDAVSGDFLMYDFHGRIFDMVVMRHVLEHLDDPVAALKKVSTLLKPGGHALFEFPNIESPGLRLKRWLRNTGLHRKTYPDGYTPGHRHEFARSSFARLAESTGFSVLSWETYSAAPLWNIFFNRVPVGNKARTLVRKI